MAVIAVKGTSIQAAWNSANNGDTLDLTPVGYAGNLNLSGKSVSVKSDGGALINGPEQDGTVNLLVNGVRGATFEGFGMRASGCSMKVQGDVTGTVFQYLDSRDPDWMVRATTTANDDTGGNHWQFDRNIGGRLYRCSARGGKAKSYDYGYDGGAFEVFGGVKDVSVEQCETWDTINITEWGKNAGQPDNTNIRFVDCVFHGRAMPTKPAYSVPYPYDSSRSYRVVNVGTYIRAFNGISFLRCEFDQLDDYSQLFQAGGGWGGGAAAAVIDGCTFRLKPGVSRIVVLNGGIPVSAVTIRGSRVYPNGCTEFALINGTRITTQAGFESNFGVQAYWGAEQSAGPADCSALEAELAGAESQIAVLTAERNAALAQSAEHRSTLDQIHALSG
jgi:hypothetical protein